MAVCVAPETSSADVLPKNGIVPIAELIAFKLNGLAHEESPMKITAKSIFLVIPVFIGNLSEFLMMSLRQPSKNSYFDTLKRIFDSFDYIKAFIVETII